MFICTTRTILVFGKTSSQIWKSVTKKTKHWKITFWDYQEYELIHQGYVLKNSPVLGCSRRGFYFWQINISGNFRHAHFGKGVHFLIFVPYWALFDPIGPYLVPIGPYLVPIGRYLVPIGPYLIPIGPYLALLGLIWPWQLNKSVTHKVPTEDTEQYYGCNT